MWMRQKQVCFLIRNIFTLNEIFSPGYSFPADIWSCGVLMAILLTGSSPFYHRREIVMLRSIMEARYSMEGPDWTGISKNAKILIKQMLTLDQSKRITAKEVLTLYLRKLI